MANEPLLLVVRSEPVGPEHLEEYHRWYADHVKQLVEVPGVLSGRRFECIDGEMQFMAQYEIENWDVFDTPPYRKIKGFGTIEPYVRSTRNVYRSMPLEGP
jgi:hypothetical protein